MTELKSKAAKAATHYIEDNMILGIGTGSTVNYFIKELASYKHRIDACVASSKATEALLREMGIPVIDLNLASEVHLYIDGADEVTASGQMIKGGGGALTREKIVANVANQFICIVDESKLVEELGQFPIAVEVIPMARSYVARRLVALGSDPVYREGFVTDNGHIILDTLGFPMTSPSAVEDAINLLPGVVENGVFSHRLADIIVVGTEQGVDCLNRIKSL